MGPGQGADLVPDPRIFARLDSFSPLRVMREDGRIKPLSD